MLSAGTIATLFTFAGAVDAMLVSEQYKSIKDSFQVSHHSHMPVSTKTKVRSGRGCVGVS